MIQDLYTYIEGIIGEIDPDLELLDDLELR